MPQVTTKRIPAIVATSNKGILSWMTGNAESKPNMIPIWDILDISQVVSSKDALVGLLGDTAQYRDAEILILDRDLPGRYNLQALVEEIRDNLPTIRVILICDGMRGADYELFTHLGSLRVYDIATKLSDRAITQSILKPATKPNYEKIMEMVTVMHQKLLADSPDVRAGLIFMPEAAEQKPVSTSPAPKVMEQRPIPVSPAPKVPPNNLKKGIASQKGPLLTPKDAAPGSPLKSGVKATGTLFEKKPFPQPAQRAAVPVPGSSPSPVAIVQEESPKPEPVVMQPVEDKEVSDFGSLLARGKHAKEVMPEPPKSEPEPAIPAGTAQDTQPTSQVTNQAEEEEEVDYDKWFADKMKNGANKQQAPNPSSNLDRIKTIMPPTKNEDFVDPDDSIPSYAQTHVPNIQNPNDTGEPVKIGNASRRRDKHNEPKSQNTGEIPVKSGGFLSKLFGGKKNQRSQISELATNDHTNQASASMDEMPPFDVGSAIDVEHSARAFDIARSRGVIQPTIDAKLMSTKKPGDNFLTPKIISLWAPKSVGKTTTVVNVATQAAMLKINTIVMDMNYITPDLGSFFGLARSTEGIDKLLRDGVRNADIDKYIKHKFGVGVLPISYNFKDISDNIDAGDIDYLLGWLQKKAKANLILVDLGPVSGEVATATTLLESDLIYLVVTQFRAGIEDTLHEIQLLTSSNIGIPIEKIRIVINQYNPASKITLDAIKQAFRLTRNPIIIPSDPVGHTGAQKLGKPYVLVHPPNQNNPWLEIINSIFDTNFGSVKI